MLIRSLVKALLVALALAGCYGGLSSREAGGGDDDQHDPSGTPPFAACVDSSDCRPAAATCCECPTFATNTDDPKVAVCDDVNCPPSTCAETVEAICNQATLQCELSCKPLACEQSCEFGFAIEVNGCLSCACAAPPSGVASCAAATDCVRTRGDCCGCEQGGLDTAVLASEAGQFDQGLMCGEDEACPGVNTCSSVEEPQCVQGRCALLAEPPANICGRPDLGPCGANEICTVNASDQANLYGVGLCVPR